jgi:plastocyanin
LSSKPTSSHAYGIGIIAILVGTAIGAGYYQMYYLPESLAKPKVSEEILNPPDKIDVKMIVGAGNPDQKDNFVPKLINVQLGVDNRVIWTNDDATPHTVTPDQPYEDSYSGEFDSPGVVKSGEYYEFLFTEAAEIDYHCTPHPWMKGKVVVTKQRF